MKEEHNDEQMEFDHRGPGPFVAVTATTTAKAQYWYGCSYPSYSGYYYPASSYNYAYGGGIDPNFALGGLLSLGLGYALFN